MLRWGSACRKGTKTKNIRRQRQKQRQKHSQSKFFVFVRNEEKISISNFGSVSKYEENVLKTLSPSRRITPVIQRD